MREDRGLAKERVLVIGDGANDLEMMAEAGTSVAFHAKPLVRGRASYSLTHAGLEGVLALFPA
jgi:phosphoserine phosphatase